jgi:hypothetical protein
LRIEPVNSNSSLYKGLQDFIRNNHLLFASPEWLANYPEKNVRQCAVLNKNNEIIGCFAYYVFKKAIYNFIISPPFTPDIDLFYVNPSASVVGRNSFNKDILTVIADYFNTLKADHISLNLPVNVVDTQPFIWKDYNSRNRYSYLIGLSKTKEELWDTLSSEKRKSINKAQKDNLVITETEDYKQVYSLISKSLERNDLLKNAAVIKNILFSFASKNNSFAFLATHNNMPIGATFCVINGDKAVYLFGGMDSEKSHHGAGVSCMWHSILKAKELNLNYFDFEGSMNPAIERYFREFGGELTPYFCVEKTKPAVKILLKLKKHKLL